MDNGTYHEMNVLDHRQFRNLLEVERVFLEDSRTSDPIQNPRYDPRWRNIIRLCYAARRVLIRVRADRIAYVRARFNLVQVLSVKT